jgi:hypothetical protein
MARLRQLRDFIDLVQKIDVMHRIDAVLLSEYVQPTTCDLWPKSGQLKKNCGSGTAVVCQLEHTSNMRAIKRCCGTCVENESRWL